MRPETLTPQPSVNTEHPVSIQMDDAGHALKFRDLGTLSARFYVGLAGLFAVWVILFLTAWAVVPSLVPGWSSVVITSGSMAPSIKTGDVVVAEPTEGQVLAPGAVIVIDDPALSGLTTHRIIGVNSDGTYRTQGDANSAADSTPVQPEHVVAVGRLLVPYAGLPLVWFWNGAWVMLGIWGLGLLGSLWVTRFAYEPPQSRLLEVEAAGRS